VAAAAAAAAPASARPPFVAAAAADDWSEWTGFTIELEVQPAAAADTGTSIPISFMVFFCPMRVLGPSNLEAGTGSVASTFLFFSRAHDFLSRLDLERPGETQ